MQVGTSAFNVRRYGLAFTGPRGQVPMIVYADEGGSLVRVSIPGQGVEVMRDDLASPLARTSVHSNPGDEAGEHSGRPASTSAPRSPGPRSGKPTGATRLPAVILLAGAAADERDGVVGGVPMLGQLAGALADAGFLAVRYDKRGFGQSGGRAESATLADQAEDALAVVRWLSKRGTIDRDRIALVGHNEGAWMALLTATRERRIAAVVSIAAAVDYLAPSACSSSSGTCSSRTALPPAERVAKIELQKPHQCSRDDRQGMGGPAPGRAEAGRHAVVPEPACVRSGAQ